MINPAATLEREVERVGETFDQSPVAHQNGVAAAGHDLCQVAGVVGVVVGEEHPADIGGVDDAEGILQPLIAVRGTSRVDYDRFGPGDNERVDIRTLAGAALDSCT